MDEDTRTSDSQGAISASSQRSSALLISTDCTTGTPASDGKNAPETKCTRDQFPSSTRNSDNTPQCDKPPSSTRTVDVTSTRREGDDDRLSWQKQLPDVVVAVYLLNPILAAQCVALSGDVLGRVLPLAALAAACRGRLGRQSGTATAVAVALAAATCLWRFYAAALILPATLMLGSGRGYKEDFKETGTREQNTDVGILSDELLRMSFDTRAFLDLCSKFAVWCAVVLGACWLGTSRSWAFLRAAAGGQLLCEDLTPNPGLYWYFFAEVFPRFRGFFRVLFLSQPYVYVLPATLRLGMFPQATVRGRGGKGARG